MDRWNDLEGVLSEPARQRLLGFHGILSGTTIDASELSMSAMSLKVATAHEFEHKTLTEGTAYGHLMLIAAALRENFRSELDFDAILKRLTRQCRTVHESNATYSSLWLQADGDSSYLRDSPSYRSWYRDAANLLSEPDHTRLKIHSVSVSMRACMNVPVMRRLDREGFDSPTAWQLPRLEKPNARLALLHMRATPDFWQRTWAECRQVVPDGIWAILNPPRPDPDSLTASFEREFNIHIGAVDQVLTARITHLLEENDAPVLHEGDSEAARSIADRLTASLPESAYGFRVSEGASERDLINIFSAERILLHAEPLSANLRRAGSLTELTAAVYREEDDSTWSLDLMIKNPSRLLEQFKLSNPDRCWLETQNDSPLCVAVGPKLEPGGFLDLVILHDSENIISAMNQVDLSVGVTISAAATMSTGFYRLGEILDLTEAQTMLCDVSLRGYLNAWEAHGRRLRYERITTRLAGIDRVSATRIQFDQNPTTFVVLSSQTAQTALKMYLDDHYPDAQDVTGTSKSPPTYSSGLAQRSLRLVIQFDYLIDQQAEIRKEDNK